MAETPLSDLAIYHARPTVRVDGEAQRKIDELLLAMEMLEYEGGMSRLELRLSNVVSTDDGGASLAFEDERILALGSALAVYAGDVDAPVEIFRGVVTGLEIEVSQDGPPELMVLAEDALQRARMARRTQVHKDVTIAGLARDIASRFGLTPRITGLDSNLGTWVQLNESDLAFLRRLLARHDGDVQVVGDELHVSPRGDVQRGGVIELQAGSQLQKIRITADLAHQVTEVTTSGWDVVDGRRVRATSSGLALGPGTGRLGSDILRDALEARSEHVGGFQVSTQDEAQALADAEFDRRARRFLVAEGTAQGNPRIRVGAHLTIGGVSARFDNTYYVVHVRHRYDVARGYETDFEAECARLGNAS